MYKQLPFGLMWLSVLFSFALVESAFGGELQGQVQTEVLHPHTFSASEVHTLSETQFIFVDGIFGDYLKANFKPALDFLAENHFATETFVMRPKTNSTIDANADLNYEKIKRYRLTSTKKNLVLIAHSKGGAETLLMVLRHPELIKALNVSAIVLVSAPIGGTDVVDFISEGKSCERDAGRICDVLNQHFPVFDSFLPAQMKALITEAMKKLSYEDKVFIESKLFYVRTQMSDLDILSPLYATHAYLNVAHPGQGANDGLIPTQNQILFEHGFDGLNGDAVFGTDLGIMMGDHNSLLNGTPFANTKAFREAFFRVLLKRVIF